MHVTGQTHLKEKNISFNFIQTINGKDEKGECVIKYPKKIFCEYARSNNKIFKKIIYIGVNFDKTSG